MIPGSILHKILSFDNSDPISFISIYFLFAFILFLIVYSFIYRNTSARNWGLIIFNLLFYYKLTGWLCLIIFIPAITDFFIALKISQTKSEKIRKVYLLTSVFISLGLLVYFKYTNFFIQIIHSIAEGTLSSWDILIPAGISYYIFRTISYVTDVYYEKIEPSKNLRDYVLYMTFFPLLISGPITRAELFLPQLSGNAGIKRENINKGLYYILKGIIKKAIIADYIGLYVNIIFSVQGGFTGFENLMGVIGFALQIYYDFSGYTDMAIGISLLLGFNIGINFNKPFQATSITDFMRRWHISLYDWLRDYIYTPLNYYFRKLKIKGTILAILITFVTCGIWHEASLLFIVWGVLYGLALSWEVLTRNIFENIKKKIPLFLYKSIGWIFTFSFVCSLLVLLKTPDLTFAKDLMAKIFTNMDLSYVVPFIQKRLLFAIIFTIGFSLIFFSHKFENRLSSLFIRTPLLLKIFIFLIVIQAIVQFQGQNILPFIYKQY